MTTVSPYARFEVTDRVSTWALTGWGTSAMTIVQDAQEASGTQPPRAETVTKAEFSMRLGPLGARGVLLEPGAAGGMNLALEANAFFVLTETGKAPNSAETAAVASRMRLVPEGARLRPSLERGLRHDRGDTETGTGVELGGGVSYSDARSRGFPSNREPLSVLEAKLSRRPMTVLLSPRLTVLWVSGTQTSLGI